ncbi:MAG TPA: hypothetical protein VGM98_09625 [Schlesneria sp.]|jgi:hypothetical protein
MDHPADVEAPKNRSRSKLFESGNRYRRSVSSATDAVIVYDHLQAAFMDLLARTAEVFLKTGQQLHLKLTDRR